MEKFEKKAKDYYEIALIAYKLQKYDVACTNYFKALSAINDNLLAEKGMQAKDHNSRFNLLKENFPQFYELTSKLFLTYRKTYTNNVDKEDALFLQTKLKEAFHNAKIKLPENDFIKGNSKKIN